MELDFQNLRKQFESLRDQHPGQSLVCATECEDGTFDLGDGPSDEVARRELHQLIQSLGAAAGCMTNAAKNGDSEGKAFAAWLRLIAEQGARAKTWSVHSVRNGPGVERTLELSLIELGELKFSESPITRCLAISEIDWDDPVIVVEQVADGRYVLVAGHEKCLESLKSGVEEVACLVQDSSRREERTTDYLMIEDVIGASLALLKKLEAEALFQQASHGDGRTETKPAGAERTPQAAVTSAEQVRSSSTENGTFRKTDSGVWEIKLDGRSSHVAHLEGLEIIRQLLENPGVPLGALRLLHRDSNAVVAAVSPSSVSSTVDSELASGFETAHGMTSDTILDATAVRDLNARLAGIDRDLDIARARGDSACEYELLDEQEKIRAELGKSQGLGGKPRRVDPGVERARKAASRSYKTALEKLLPCLPSVAQHFEQFIETGARFTYKGSIRWFTR